MLATVGLWFYGVWLRRVEPGRSWPEWKRVIAAGLALAAMLLPVWLNGVAGRHVYEPGALLTNNQAYEILYGLCLGGKDAYHAMFRTELTTAFGTGGSAAPGRALRGGVSRASGEYPDGAGSDLAAVPV